jgi:hypothetical protein
VALMSPASLQFAPDFLSYGTGAENLSSDISLFRLWLKYAK